MKKPSRVKAAHDSALNWPKPCQWVRPQFAADKLFRRGVNRVIVPLRSVSETSVVVHFLLLVDRGRSLFQIRIVVILMHSNNCPAHIDDGADEGVTKLLRPFKEPIVSDVLARRVPYALGRIQFWPRAEAGTPSNSDGSLGTSDGGDRRRAPLLALRKPDSSPIKSCLPDGCR